ncbi:MAG: hypothetical protein ABIL02_04015 [candidate division WOR-3 bacterium]
MIFNVIDATLRNFNCPKSKFIRLTFQLRRTISEIVSIFKNHTRLTKDKWSVFEISSKRIY